MSRGETVVVRGRFEGRPRSVEVSRDRPASYSSSRQCWMMFESRVDDSGECR